MPSVALAGRRVLTSWLPFGSEGVARSGCRESATWETRGRRPHQVRAGEAGPGAVGLSSLPVRGHEGHVRGVRARQEHRKGGLGSPGGRDGAHGHATQQADQHDDGEVAGPPACPAWSGTGTRRSPIGAAVIGPLSTPWRAVRRVVADGRRSRQHDHGATGAARSARGFFDLLHKLEADAARAPPRRRCGACRSPPPTVRGPHRTSWRASSASRSSTNSAGCKNPSSGSVQASS